MYKLHLILKYLRRRRIAWVSLVAVTLCTAMVIVVISIMGGWLRMFEDSARGMTGDVVVKSAGLSGFAYYQEMVERIKRLPDVEGAVPQIKTLGVVNIGVGREGKKTDGVQVVGVQMDQVATVNKWPQSLFQQHTSYTERGLTPPAEKTFDLRRVNAARLARLPDGVADPLARTLAWLPFGRPLAYDVFDFVPHPLVAAADPAGTAGPAAAPLPAFYLPARSDLMFYGKMDAATRDALSAADGGKGWRDAVRTLARESNQPGMIAGARVIEVKKDREGNLVGRDAWKYQDLWAKLTVFGVGANQELDWAGNRAERTYWIVDDSRTGMWQYDNGTVYVAFDVLQQDLGMQAGEVETLGPDGQGTGRKVMTPARTTEINVRLRPGADVRAARDRVRDVVERVTDARALGPLAYRDPPRVETWREASAMYLDQIEREKVMMVMLFAVISVVAVFLIFCIFYMIVAEKTKDIGIVKSVGATNGGVAGIFLGYGLAIGLVGAGLGLLLSYLIVHNVNEIHDWLGRTFRLVVYNPEVYAFDTIPNRMDPPTVAVILGIAVLASVVGALVPAVRAARMQPVEALRWE